MHNIKSLFISFLSFMMFSMPALAIENSTVTTTQEEYYNASSPVGYFEQYPAGSYVQTTTTGYGDFNQQVIYIPQNNAKPVTVATTSPSTTYTQSMPATRQQIDVPQKYDKKVVTTQVTRDDRETADKVLDRTGKAVAIIGIGGLLAAAVTAIFCSIH